MSLFATQLPVEKRLPILNKPPESIETQNDASTSDCQDDEESIPNLISQTQTTQNGRKLEQESTQSCETHIQFQCFTYFAISTKSVNELCADLSSDGVDVHIFFEEDFPRLPRIGFSCLSLQELYEDHALLHDENATPDQLGFIQLVRLVDAGLNEIPSWVMVSPKRGQTFSVSLDVADGIGVRIRFSFESVSPTPWYSVRFPPYKSDFSLVIDVAKNEVLPHDEINTLTVLSTFGWLDRMLNLKRYSKNCRNGREEMAAAQLAQEKQRAEMNVGGLNSELVKGECTLCFDADSDTLFYPCCHLNVHRKCLPTAAVEECYACREKCEELISIRQRSSDCKFCNPSRGCREFDSFFYPCGCSRGCMDGFKSFSQRMGINCPDCGSAIQNVLKIFISNAST